MKQKWLLQIVLVASAALLLLGCMSVEAMYGITKYKVPTSPLKSDSIEITFTKLQSDLNATNYGFDVIVKNVSSEEVTFDSGELELTDLNSGISYYSISKDKESVSLPKGYERTITRSTLKAGRAISGLFYFVTGQGEAHAKQLKLVYKGAEVILKPE